ncbi:MAG: hypothetical protein IKR19_09015 [Acholeplasmatales bacterium]|nr:hypothetical protein [Acholeplasmatales bacterium]
MRFIFRRSTDADFSKKNKVLHFNEIYCVLDESQIDIIDNIEELEKIRAKFKVGDGKHHYRDLPFESGTIPVVINLYPNTEKRGLFNHNKKDEDLY